MLKRLSNWQEMRVFARYFAVSAGALLLDIACYGLSISGGTPPAIAASVSYIIGLLGHYLLSRLFVFRADGAAAQQLAQFVSFCISGLIGLGVTSGIVYVAHHLAHLHPMAAKAIAVLVSFISVYAIRRVIVFGQGLR